VEPAQPRDGGEEPGVALWVLSARGAEHAPVDTGALDPAELARAAEIADPHARARYLLAHVTLRRHLGRFLDLDPGAITFARLPCPVCGGPTGRPTVVDAPRPVHFSLSARGDVVLIGVAGVPLGVDVEVIPRFGTVPDVTRLLHPAEAAELAASPPDDHAVAFTRLWTRKEAYLKATGAGIAHGLGTAYVGLADDAGAPPGWRLRRVGVPPGYRAAAAVAVP